jgi:putative iron-regulated protein
VIQNYARLLFANYSDTEAAAVRLREAIDELVANPAQVTLDAARAAWLAARPTYQQSEIGRFYEGPIDNEENGPEGRVNGWPLDENFIDYTASSPDAGIINAVSQYPTLSKELIASLNEQGSEANISAGWHGIEFLLWGQDLRTDGPGARPYTDYVTGAGGTAANQDRRGQYLRFIAELLVDDLRAVKEQWAPGGGDNYRAAFVALEPEIALARILTGIGTLSGFELSNERMAVALETQDQEDEHSCFSDNTHVDHRFDQLGIDNVYFGRYGSLDGPGIDDLVRAADPALDQQMQAALQASRTAIYAMPIPFDQSILGADTQPARQAIIAAVNALRAQTALIEDVAAALGVDITTTQ